MKMSDWVNEWMRVIERLLGLVCVCVCVAAVHSILFYSEVDLIQTENKVKMKFKPLVIVVVVAVADIHNDNNIIIDRCNPWMKASKKKVKEAEKIPESVTWFMWTPFST